MNRSRTARILQRSPGEVAFDQTSFALTALCRVCALVSVARVWHDPSARVLRFSAVGLLLFLAGATVHLLRVPFS